MISSVKATVTQTASGSTEGQELGAQAGSCRVQVLGLQAAHRQPIMRDSHCS
jgi:hypothetical protein